METLSPATCMLRTRGNGKKKTSWHLRCVVEYNKYMDGVDLSDQLIQYYSVHKRSNRWYRTLLYHFIDIAATNSYILHKEMCLSSGSVAMSHAQFMPGPNWQLCATQRGTMLARESMSCADEEEEEEGIDSFARLRSGDTARKGRRKCVLCKKRSIWKCARCDLTLCLVAHRNCLSKWHSSRT